MENERKAPHGAALMYALILAVPFYITVYKLWALL